MRRKSKCNYNPDGWKRGIRSLFSLLLAATMSFGSISVPAIAKSTSDKLKEAQKEQEDTEDRLEEASDKIDDLKDTKAGLQKNLSGLNSELANVSDKIAEIEEKERVKEDEISTTEAEIARAEEERVTQYRYIKARIRALYENGQDSYFDLFMQMKDFSDFLNRAEYISRVNQYDQEVLENYRILIEETKAKKEKLEQDRSELASLREDAVAEQEKVQKLVNQTKNSITAYAGEISEAEAEALAYEAKLVAAKNNVNALKEQLKREEELARLSQSMKKRSLSEVTTSAGEKEMLAALIQCEAGGEPWAGKIAVGAVVMNRVMSGAFPSTITGVIYQSGQFEPVSSGRFAIVLARGANAECTRAAEQAMAGVNNIGECLFFRTIVPDIHGTIIGHHVFYLYWTGKYSGYGTADESLADGQEAAKQNAQESGVSTDPNNGETQETPAEEGGNEDTQSGENSEGDNSGNNEENSEENQEEEKKSDEDNSEEKSEEKKSDEEKSDDSEEENDA
ncbi:MAG: cell wall hydrolase [Lachnospiraceae bacterium]|nr:cell wall hydrolase [Lachnospiraceae bacterium]